MNKILLSSSLVLLVGLGFTACSSDPQPKPDEKPIAISECVIDQADAPKWACGIINGYDDMFTATGTAKMSKAGAGFSRKNAMADGRSNLAHQIEVEVKAKITQFAATTGIGEDETVDSAITQVSKQVAKVTLNGSKQLAYWQHPKNSDIYVLMGVSKEGVNNAANQNVHSSLGNQNALWQKFQAENALKGLEEDTKDK